MRKLLFLLMVLLPNIGNAEEPQITLNPLGYSIEELQRNQAVTTFTAEKLTNGSIKVLSSDVTTFTVKICNASTGAILYQGSTVEGVLHITAHFWQAGRYVLQIETAGAYYVGEFSI